MFKFKDLQFSWQCYVAEDFRKQLTIPQFSRLEEKIGRKPDEILENGALRAAIFYSDEYELEFGFKDDLFQYHKLLIYQADLSFIKDLLTKKNILLDLRPHCIFLDDRKAIYFPSDTSTKLLKVFGCMNEDSFSSEQDAQARIHNM